MNENILASLRRHAAACTACELHQNRSKAVCGIGKTSARLMFVGEGPGVDEDRTGEPFTGVSGQLQRRIVAAIGMTAGEVFMSNLVRCRVPSDTKLKKTEIEACRAHLEAEIEAVKPAVIVALGRLAWRWFEPADRRAMGELRGELVLAPDGTALWLPTYNAAYLMRRPEAKGDVWTDMKRVRSVLRRLANGETPQHLADRSAIIQAEPENRNVGLPLMP